MIVSCVPACPFWNLLWGAPDEAGDSSNGLSGECREGETERAETSLTGNPLFGFGGRCKEGRGIFLETRETIGEEVRTFARMREVRPELWAGLGESARAVAGAMGQGVQA